MVVTIDSTTEIEEPKSVENRNAQDPLHPWNKTPIATRLANTALHEIYGKENVKHLYPMPENVTADGKYIFIEYSGVYDGLVTTGTTPENFEIIDGQGKYHTPTHTELYSENTVMLYCDDVAEPAGVCYFHEEHLVDLSLSFPKFTPSLENSEGLPASPFTYMITEEDRTAFGERISVPAGSVVYFADGTSKAYSQATSVVVPAKEGYIYVNKGFESHEVYYVDADGNTEKLTYLENAILGFNGAGIRTSGVQGIRFRASVSDISRELSESEDGYEISEYGFVVTAETKASGLSGKDYTLDMALVNSKKAVKGVAYNKNSGKDIVFENTDNRTVFTSVLKNIPFENKALTTQIASRPYYILTDGETEIVIYGEITKRSVYDVAKAIKNSGGSDYTDNKEYVDSIIDIVTSTIQSDDEIVFDVSDLFRN
jgi:hypothetical protein